MKAQERDAVANGGQLHFLTVAEFGVNGVQFMRGSTNR
jgi:hypothetical protein